MCFRMTEKETEVAVLAFDVCCYSNMENAEMLSYTQGSSLVCYLLVPELFC